MPLHTEFHLGTLGAFQPAHGLLIGHFLSHERFVVHRDDTVARQDAHILRRSPLDDIVHMHRVVFYGELHAYTAETAAELIVSCGSVLC